MPDPNALDADLLLRLLGLKTYEAEKAALDRDAALRALEARPEPPKEK